MVLVYWHHFLSGQNRYNYCVWKFSHHRGVAGYSAKKTQGHSHYFLGPGSLAGKFICHRSSKVQRNPRYGRCLGTVYLSKLRPNSGPISAFFSHIKKYGGAAERIAYFPNTAEELYKPVTLPVDAPERQNIPPGFCIMFAGNIGAAQDFGTIIGAAELVKDIKDIQWVILGDGRMRPWVEEQVQARGLTDKVHLLGQHPAAAMPRYFALADALLVTLKKEPIFALTIPCKIQSYLACAKPIIAALDGEGARIVTESGVGLTCPAENPELLVEAVLGLYRLPEAERREMGRRGRDYFDKNFERTMLFDRLEGWMKALRQGEGLCAS